MDKVCRRYKKLFKKVWLSLNMASKSVKSSDTDKSERHLGRTLLQKPGILDLTASRNYIDEHPDNWEQVEDRIIRVLTYKYYDCDVNLLHSSDSFVHDTASSLCLDEREMEILNLQEFVDVLLVPLEFEITRQFMPVLEQPQLMTIVDDGTCRKAWKCIRSIFTLKSCRQAEDIV